MTEQMIVEAIRAAGTAPGTQIPVPGPTCDPVAAARFQDALAARAPTDVPLAQQLSDTWRQAQDSHQGLVHRVEALAAMSRTHVLSAAQLAELQYDVATLSFQQEMVTNVAKKASDAVSTLVKNG